MYAQIVVAGQDLSNYGCQKLACGQQQPCQTRDEKLARTDL